MHSTAFSNIGCDNHFKCNLKVNSERSFSLTAALKTFPSPKTQIKTQNDFYPPPKSSNTCPHQKNPNSSNQKDSQKTYQTQIKASNHYKSSPNQRTKPSSNESTQILEILTFSKNPNKYKLEAELNSKK